MNRKTRRRIARLNGQTIHHRKPKFFNGTDDRWNMIGVDEKRHIAFHYIFSINGRPMTIEEIVRDLSQTWIDPSWIITAQRR